MNKETSADAYAHAVREYPRESCGLIVQTADGEKYFPCRNISESPIAHVQLHHEDYVAAELQGEIVAMVHSHPGGSARPSEGDLVACEAAGIEYIILSVGCDPADESKKPRVVETSSIVPKGYRAPLLGRQYVHGILDCYSLIQDYYNWELGIILPEFEYPEEWWKKGQNLYMDNFAAAGFERIERLEQNGDIIFMMIRSKVVNHAGVFIGRDKFYHHMYNRLSTMETYGGYWANVTRMFLRKVK